MKPTSMFAALLSIGVAAHAMAAVEARPLRIEETRSASLVEEDLFHPTDLLKIVFSLIGPEADAAIRYGDLKLDEAVDDKGTNLIPKKIDPLSTPSKYKEYDNAFMRKMAVEQKEAPERPQFHLELAPAKRSATKIARLRGTLNLSTQGTIKTIEASKLKTAVKKKLDIPASAGISITVSIQPGPNIQSISVDITGDENALESIELVTATGETLSTGITTWSINDGPPQKALVFTQPLDDSMKLIAKIAVDRKITPVKFDLKDIALP